MNVIVLILLTHQLLWIHGRRLIRAGDLRPRLAALRLALDRRDYLLSSLCPPCTRGEAELDACVLRQIRAGRLRPDQLSRASAVWQRLALLQESIEKQLLLTLLHGGLCLSLSMGGLLLLRHTWHLTFDSALGLGFCVYGAALTLMRQRLPRPFLSADETLLKSFIAAWFGEVARGPWQLQLQELEERAWREGRAQDEAWRQVLETWMTGEETRIAQSLLLHEHALTVWELGLSLLLGLCLWTEPLIALFEQVLVS